jgi:hypothetical protein
MSYTELIYKYTRLCSENNRHDTSCYSMHAIHGNHFCIMQLIGIGVVVGEPLKSPLQYFVCMDTMQTAMEDRVVHG